MEIYTQYYSTLSFNGKEILADTFKWGLMTLSGDRLTQFETDFEEITDFMMNSGKFSRENVYSASLDQNGNKIIIGERFFYQDTYFAHEKFLHWQNEFRNDPNVITYRSMVKEQ